MARGTGKYKVACPVCGKPLFTSATAEIDDICCPKCRTRYAVKVETGTLQIRENELQYSADE
ncbi:hypothetical protein [Acetoanaerobium noterae]|uniref:hypothetical protein n=1 Tax=Acetoanaerobium noterae TaxID=745369 RepID=UPI0032213C16